jgi:hypothetical protein
MIAAWKRRVEECQVRAQELRAKAETLSDAQEREKTLRDAETWQRMADWAEKNPPPSN